MVKETEVKELKRREIEQEFYRIAEELTHQGDLGVITDMIGLDTKKEFIKNYKEGI